MNKQLDHDFYNKDEIHIHEMLVVKVKKPNKYIDTILNINIH